MRHVQRYIFVVGLVGVFSASCEDLRRAEFPNFETSLLDLAREQSDLSTFVSLAEESGFGTVLESPESQVTVFAPTDAAFSALDPSTLERWREDTAELNRVLRFHTTGGVVGPPLLEILPEIRTITGSTVALSRDGETFVLDGSSRVVELGIQGDNGLLHKIDAVLDPGPEGPGSIVDVARSAGLTELVGALEMTGLSSTLMMPGPFTVFAPTNEAFGAVDLSVVDSGVIANTLLTHVVSGSLDSSVVTSSASLTTAANTSIPVDGAAVPATVGGASLSSDASQLDVTADNGVVHIVDGIIIPPTTLEVAEATAILSTLVSAVSAAPSAIRDVLDPDTLATGEMPITLFAPTNDAFDRAGIDPTTSSSTALALVLSNHVVMGQRLASELTEGLVLPTQVGTTTVTVEGDTIFVLDGAGDPAEVVIEDVRTRSGVVHVIDRVLVP